MLSTSLRAVSWKFGVVPAIMGVFFGLGHFLAYYFFAREPFRRFERSLNSLLNEIF